MPRELKEAGERAEAPIVCASEDPIGTWRAWWGQAPSRLGPDTCRQYRYWTLRTLADLGDLIGLSRPALARYLGAMRPQQGRAARCALNDFYKWAALRGERADNPLENLHRPRGQRLKVRRALSQEELARVVIAAVWAGVGRARWSGQDVGWTILGLYSTGLRPGEFLALGPGKVRLNGDSSCVFVEGTKTGYDRAVPLGSLGREAFGNLLSPGRLRVSPVARTQLWARIRRAALLAGIDSERAKPYALRHSFATHLIERGVDVRRVAELLGHTSLRHTMVYTVPSDTELRAAVNLLG